MPPFCLRVSLYPVYSGFLVCCSVSGAVCNSVLTVTSSLGTITTCCSGVCSDRALETCFMVAPVQFPLYAWGHDVVFFSWRII